MLLEIAKLPTAENTVIHLNAADNIAVARVPISAGTELKVDGQALTALDYIPAGHKIALARIERGETVRRYGQIIGRASTVIEPGRHVHTHNLAFEELHFDYEYPTAETPLAARRASPTFLGYPREDGRVGTRNYIAVVAASNCPPTSMV
jgi:altronate hydrolase